MNSVLKSIGLLLFSAGDEIEQRAEAFQKKRKERFEKMEYTMKKGKKEMLSSFGLATIEEVNELKKRIEELNARIDSLSE